MPDHRDRGRGDVGVSVRGESSGGLSARLDAAASADQSRPEQHDARDPRREQRSPAQRRRGPLGREARAIGRGGGGGGGGERRSERIERADRDEHGRRMRAERRQRQRAGPAAQRPEQRRKVVRIRSSDATQQRRAEGPAAKAPPARERPDLSRERGQSLWLSERLLAFCAQAAPRPRSPVPSPIARSITVPSFAGGLMAF
jgi:hypothetical protein